MKKVFFIFYFFFVSSNLNAVFPGFFEPVVNYLSGFWDELNQEDKNEKINDKNDGKENDGKIEETIDNLINANISFEFKKKLEKEYDDLFKKKLDEELKKKDEEEYESKKAAECSICYEKLRDGSQINYEFPCSDKHVFHKKCIQVWFKRSKECPLCRALITGVDDDSIVYLEKSALTQEFLENISLIEETKKQIFSSNKKKNWLKQGNELIQAQKSFEKVLKKIEAKIFYIEDRKDMLFFKNCTFSEPELLQYLLTRIEGIKEIFFINTIFDMTGKQIFFNKNQFVSLFNCIVKNEIESNSGFMSIKSNLGEIYDADRADIVWNFDGNLCKINTKKSKQCMIL